jgi:hypothetical protein
VVKAIRCFFFLEGIKMPQSVLTPSGVTTPISYDYGVSLGLIPGHSHQRAVGVAPSVATSTTTDIWAGSVGTALYPFLTTAQNLEIVSSSASDTVIGTGAKIVQLMLLDANFNQVTQTVIMSGTSPVAISGGPYLRCNQMVVLSAGSSLTNAGNITLRVSGAGSTVSYMAAAVGIAQTSIYTVPNGYTLVVDYAYFNLQSTGTAANWANVGVYVQTNGSTAGLYQRFQTTVTGSGQAIVPLPSPVTITQGTDFILRVTNTSGTVAVAGSWQGVLVNNVELI